MAPRGEVGRDEGRRWGGFRAHFPWWALSRVQNCWATIAPPENNITHANCTWLMTKERQYLQSSKGKEFWLNVFSQTAKKEKKTIPTNPQIKKKFYYLQIVSEGMCCSTYTSRVKAGAQDEGRHATQEKVEVMNAEMSSSLFWVKLRVKQSPNAENVDTTCSINLKKFNTWLPGEGMWDELC